MNILVVGGTRFFGIPMVEKLLLYRHDVTVATRGTSPNSFGDRVKYIVMDRVDYDSVKDALSGKEYDVIIDKIAYSSNDVKNLLENVRCKRYIQMSSCSVYYDDKENISENSFNTAGHELVWGDRNEDYAGGKRQAERATLEYLDESQCVFVRYPVVLGPNDYTGRLKFYVDHVMQEKPMNIDDMDFKLAYIHEKEAGEFIAHLVSQNFSGAVNGCSKGMISPGDIISYVEKISDKRAIIEPNGDAAPYNGATANVSYDTSKAASTGFEFSNIEEWIYELIDQIKG